MTITKCDRCEYEWDYKGKTIMATCPSCYKKVKTKKEE